MEVDEMVDAATGGPRQQRSFDILALEDLQMWQDYDKARGKMLPHLSRNKSVSRYQQN